MIEHETQDGQCSRHSIDLRPGLSLHVADFNPRETLKMHFETKASCLRFIFLRQGKGHMDWSVSNGTFVTKRVLTIERSSSVSFCPELEGTICLPAEHRQSHFSIRVSPTLLNMLLGERFERVPHDLQAIFDGCNTIDFYHCGPLSPVMNQVIDELVHCPYSGPLGLIYRESRAMELVGHKMAQIVSSSEASSQPTRMRVVDVERVRCARDILERNLEDPPRLFDLARAVGTSHSQLNRSFRMMYGISVFGYLRKLRLEEARHLLEQGSMNVTEAALAVGYNSIASFSRAFSEYFGSKPVGFLKKA